VQEPEQSFCNAGCNASRISKGGETLGTSESTVKAVRYNLDRYAEFIDANPSYVVSEALKLLFKKDEEFKRWACQHANGHSTEQIQGEPFTKTE